MLPPTLTQLYLVSIRFRRKISFVTSFTISDWLKKYYFIWHESLFLIIYWINKCATSWLMVILSSYLSKGKETSPGDIENAVLNIFFNNPFNHQNLWHCCLHGYVWFILTYCHDDGYKKCNSWYCLWNYDACLFKWLI